MRRFVILGQTAVASPEFLLGDIAGTSGRLDVLLRSLRAALLVSHGLRADAVAYLVLMGGPRAPRTLRFEGATARFIRPDERNLGTLVQKVLAAPCGSTSFSTFAPFRAGIAIADRGLEAVLEDLRGARPFVVEQGGPDLRSTALAPGEDTAFFFGDHRGFDASTRVALAAVGARPVGLGPVRVHTDDAVALVNNELDRRAP